MRTIEFETNYNQKLNNNSFVHISLAPFGPVPESKLSESITICVLDTPGLQVTVQLKDICRLKLCQLLSIHTLPSHGLVYDDFIAWWKLKYPKYESDDTPVAVYYYVRLSE
jgi:hypothetical protein